MHVYASVALVQNLLGDSMKIEHCLVTHTPLFITLSDGSSDYAMPLDITYSTDQGPCLSAYLKNEHTIKSIPISSFEFKPLSGINAEIVRFFHKAFVRKTSPVALVPTFNEYCRLNRFKMSAMG